MPAYISHAIMGEDLYNRSNQDERLFKIELESKEIQGYSLGVDLSYLSKKTKSQPHLAYTQDFFLAMISYIKHNNLVDNKHIIALLYGHIAHYFLDTQTHPFIYYLESESHTVGLIPNHDLVEGYLSAYLSETVLHKDIMEIKPDYFNQINLSKSEVETMINSIYGNIYSDNQMIYSYKKTLRLFSAIDTIVKYSHISKKFLLFISQFESFLNKNNLTRGNLINENHEIYTNPITGEPQEDSFIELYEKAIELTQEAIFEVNKYLYQDVPLSNLTNIFTDLSYDSGVKCSLGRKMSYVRKRILSRKK